MKFILSVACLFIVACSNANSYTPKKIEPVPSYEFVPVPFSAKVIDGHRPIAKPTTKPSVVKKVAPKPKPVVTTKTRQGTAKGGILASGQASWYCRSGVSICTRGHPGGLYAAIRRDLLYLRGRSISVCTSSKCIRVTVIDCNCGTHANLIDLYSDAYRRLAPLSSGRINVRIYK